MADDGHSGAAGEGEGDICSFFASFINQRQQVERLLDWLRESQTVCTDSNCFDEINGLPGTEQGGPLMTGGDDNSAYYQDETEQGPIAMVMCLLLGLLTLYAMSLNAANRQQETNKSTRSPDDDDDHQQHRRRNNDDNSRPAL